MKKDQEEGKEDLMGNNNMREGYQILVQQGSTQFKERIMLILVALVLLAQYHLQEVRLLTHA